MGFPITIICTLQGTSVTQGNPAIFTGNKFAVYLLDMPYSIGLK